MYACLPCVCLAPSEAKRGFASPKTGVIDCFNYHVGVGNEFRSSGRVVCALNHERISLIPMSHFLYPFHCHWTSMLVP